MNEIRDYKHVIKIDNEKIVLSISFINGLWTSKVLSGDAAIGNSSGGKYNSLEDYIKHLETEHRYAYNFFKHGYKYAKENIKK